LPRVSVRADGGGERQGMGRTIVVIDKLVLGGKGFGRLGDGMVVLVEGALAGERVAVRLGKQRRGYREAELLEVLEPSPARVSPPCPHYGRCGGCDFQHLAAEQQAAAKAAMFVEHLARQGEAGVAISGAVVLEPVPAPEFFYYRQRIRLQVVNGRLGFRQARSHRLEPVGSCQLAHPAINGALDRLVASPAMGRLLGQSRELELLASPADQDVVLLLHFGRKPRAADRQAAEAVVAEAGVRGLLLQVEGQGVVGPFGGTGDEMLRRFVLPGMGAAGRDLCLAVEPGGFSQVNPAQNVNLIREMLALLAHQRPGRVLDCHCGVGNFSLPLAVAAGEVVGCDVQGAAIRGARRNAAGNSIANCRFEKRPALDFVSQLVAGGETFDTVLLDPPRQGCADIVPLLPRLRAERMVYISCDPATLVRDLGGLGGHGYAVRSLRVVDMFPQTRHLEVITLLERR